MFGEICGLEVVPCSAEEPVLMAMISFVGDIEWSVYIGLPQSTVVGVVSSFAGFDIPFDSDEMNDAVGELANLLAGKIKESLFRQGLRTEISLPAVFRGEKMQVLRGCEQPGVVTWFRSSHGKFWVEVTAGATTQAEWPMDAESSAAAPTALQAEPSAEDASSTSSLEHRGAVIEALANVFHTVCSMSLEPQTEAVDSTLAQEEAIIAVISLVGAVELSLYLGLPRDVATGAAEAFAGFEIPFESEDMGDAVGELANILAGDVKVKMYDLGLKTEISLPNVMRGTNISVRPPTGVPSETTCFASPAGKLWLTVVAAKAEDLGL